MRFGHVEQRIHYTFTCVTELCTYVESDFIQACPHTLLIRCLTEPFVKFTPLVMLIVDLPTHRSSSFWINGCRAWATVQSLASSLGSICRVSNHLNTCHASTLPLFSLLCLIPRPFPFPSCPPTYSFSPLFAWLHSLSAFLFLKLTNILYIHVRELVLIVLIASIFHHFNTHWRFYSDVTFSFL